MFMIAYLYESPSLHNQFEEPVKIQGLLGHNGDPSNGSTYTANHSVCLKSMWVVKFIKFVDIDINALCNSTTGIVITSLCDEWR